MGIRDFTSFINTHHSNAKEPYELHDTTIIIDGGNCINFLFMKSDMNFEVGGDYGRFANTIQDYFERLQKCHIKPIIIFDGGVDPSNRKTATLLKRLKKKVKTSVEVARTGRSPNGYLPLLCYEVFLEVTSKMGILHLRCSFEADQELSSVANHFKCPVLSNDSDFFIYDLKCGFIRTDDLNTNICTKTENGKLKQYLKCKIYFRDKFLSNYPGVDKSHLPLFSSMFGNDFIESYDFKKFFEGILPGVDRKYKNQRINKIHINMIKFFSFFKDLSWDDSLDKVLSYLHESEDGEFHKKLNVVKDFYNTSEIHLLSFINNEQDINDTWCSCMGSENSKVTKNDTCNMLSNGKNRFPDWFVRKFHQSEFSPIFLDAPASRKVFMHPQIENPNCSSSHDCSLSIRTVFYSILASVDSEYLQKVDTICIEERGMSFGHTTTKNVALIECTKSEIRIPNLACLSKLDDQSKKELMLDVLEVIESFISKFPEKYKFVAAIISYWLKHCKIQKEFLYAVVVSFIYFNEIKPFEENREQARKISCTTASEASKVSKIFHQLFTTHNFFPTSKTDLKFVHNYSQFQSCTMYAMHLNILLGNVFENPKVHKCFNGTLTGNIARNFVKQGQLVEYISEIFAKSKSLISLFSLFTNNL